MFEYELDSLRLQKNSLQRKMTVKRKKADKKASNLAKSEYHKIIGKEKIAKNAYTHLSNDWSFTLQQVRSMKGCYYQSFLTP